MHGARRAGRPRAAGRRAPASARAGAAACSDAELLGVLLDGGLGGAAAHGARRARAPASGRHRPARARSARRRGAARPALAAAAGAGARRARARPARGGAAAGVRRCRCATRRAVYAHFRGRLPQLEREVFYVLLLDGQNRVQARCGSPRARSPPRWCIRARCSRRRSAPRPPRSSWSTTTRAAIPTPSAEDAALTERLRQAGELIGIRVLDHVVIGRGRYVSMAEAGRW